MPPPATIGTRRVPRLLSVLISHHFQMTPLRRWVLLALLLAAVAAHPFEHACVHLCRARDTSPEKITGVCQHQQKLVLQSSGGRFPIHRLFSLCLTPCHGSSDRLVFDDSHACRTFRETLVQYHGCSCNDYVDHEGTWNDEEDPRGGKEFEEDRSREVGESKMLKKADGEQVPADVRGQGLKIKDLPATELEAVEGMSDEADVEDAGTDDADKGASKEESEDVAATGDEANSTDETSVDWDRWCMTQCDHGNGGSACHCDLIP
ncbi:hypothetical protein WN51_03060 [Melipona quadrifasciata]|uniref:Uncharacterized protein n=1 Tax=Melipona quadrifasciata TaxID=166423 RepID=A0A0N0U4K2_9HYME|nr:hypothetical protein WN51_03060 [Melipona quadrifasciata]